MPDSPLILLNDVLIVDGFKEDTTKNIRTKVPPEVFSQSISVCWLRVAHTMQGENREFRHDSYCNVSPTRASEVLRKRHSPLLFERSRCRERALWEQATLYSSPLRRTLSC